MKPNTTTAAERRDRLRRTAPFWRPLSPDELHHEQTATREFLALLHDGEHDAALREFKRFNPPAGVWDAFTADPIVLRLLLYTFHPRRDDPETWRRLRPYASYEQLQHLLGLGPSLMRQGTPLQWVELVAAIYSAIDYAQRTKERGDSRAFEAIVDEFRQQCLGSTTTTAHGELNVTTMPFVGGGGVTSRLLTRHDGTQHEELIFDMPHAVDSDEFREFVDRTILRRIQQFAASPEHRDGFFSPPPGFERVMKLVHDGEVILGRPMHLITNYAPLIASFVKRYVFEREYAPDPEHGTTKRLPDREVSTQEVRTALFEAAMAYQQDFGFVPGVLRARIRGALTSRVRDTSVSHKIDGRRRLTGEIEHSGDAMAEGPSGADESDTDTPNAFDAVDGYGHVHPKREGARQWTDEGLAHVTRRELLESLTEDQRELTLLLMNGLIPADAARALGVSRSAVSQMIERIRPLLRAVLDRSK